MVPSFRLFLSSCFRDAMFSEPCSWRRRCGGRSSTRRLRFVVSIGAEVDSNRLARPLEGHIHCIMEFWAALMPQAMTRPRIALSDGRSRRNRICQHSSELIEKIDGVHTGNEEGSHGPDCSCCQRRGHITQEAGASLGSIDLPTGAGNFFRGVIPNQDMLTDWRVRM